MAGAFSLKVHNPSGTLEVIQGHAPRLPGLNGRTICELSNALWEDHRIFPYIRQLLKERFPEAKIIPYTEFPMGTEPVENEATIDKLEQKGCEAVITGIAA
jgi:hypothetical protein